MTPQQYQDEGDPHIASLIRSDSLVRSRQVFIRRCFMAVLIACLLISLAMVLTGFIEKWILLAALGLSFSVITILAFLAYVLVRHSRLKDKGLLVPILAAVVFIGMGVTMVLLPTFLVLANISTSFMTQSFVFGSVMMEVNQVFMIGGMLLAGSTLLFHMLHLWLHLKDAKQRQNTHFYVKWKNTGKERFVVGALMTTGTLMMLGGIYALGVIKGLGIAGITLGTLLVVITCLIHVMRIFKPWSRLGSHASLDNPSSPWQTLESIRVRQQEPLETVPLVDSARPALGRTDDPTNPTVTLSPTPATPKAAVLPPPLPPHTYVIPSPSSPFQKPVPSTKLGRQHPEASTKFDASVISAARAKLRSTPTQPFSPIRNSERERLTSQFGKESLPATPKKSVIDHADYGSVRGTDL